MRVICIEGKPLFGELQVSSKSKAEAKKKAWEKFIKKVPKRIFEVDVEYETY